MLDMTNNSLGGYNSQGQTSQSVASFGVQDGPGFGGGNSRMSQAQQKVAQTKNIMQSNVQKMIDNQNELGDIEQRSGDLKNIAFNVRNNAD